MYTDRRNWLKQTALFLGAIGMNTDLFATQKRTAGSLTGKILLNSNENPYGPSPLAKQAILDHYLQSNRYPDDLVIELKKKLV